MEYHWCGDKCKCPIHKTQMFYNRWYDKHGCQNTECEHADANVWANITIKEKIVARVVEYIYDNYNSKITLDDISVIAGYSKYYFNSIFCSIVGITPMTFTILVRMDKAKTLLSTTGHSVTEICKMVGWSSFGTFSTRFKSIVGVTPSAYRRGGVDLD